MKKKMQCFKFLSRPMTSPALPTSVTSPIKTWKPWGGGGLASIGSRFGSESSYPSFRHRAFSSNSTVEELEKTLCPFALSDYVTLGRTSKDAKLESEAQKGQRILR